MPEVEETWKMGKPQMRQPLQQSLGFPMLYSDTAGGHKALHWTLGAFWEHLEMHHLAKHNSWFA